MADYQYFSSSWLVRVIVFGLFTLSITTLALVPLLKNLSHPRILRMPVWLRWALLVPVAFTVSTVAEIIPKFLFSLYEVSINHTLTFRPGIDSLIWSAYAPLFFVIAGAKVAPSRRLTVYLVLGVFKIIVAVTNIYTVLSVTSAGMSWSRTDTLINSPLWWNFSVYIIGICLIIVSAIVTMMETKTPEEDI